MRALMAAFVLLLAPCSGVSQAVVETFPGEACWGAAPAPASLAEFELGSVLSRALGGSSQEGFGGLAGGCGEP